MVVDTDREQRRNTVVQSGVFKVALASMESACLRPCSAAVAASAITAGTRWNSAKPILAVCKRRREPQVVAESCTASLCFPIRIKYMYMYMYMLYEEPITSWSC